MLKNQIPTNNSAPPPTPPPALPADYDWRIRLKGYGYMNEVAARCPFIAVSSYSILEACTIIWNQMLLGGESGEGVEESYTGRHILNHH